MAKDSSKNWFRVYRDLLSEDLWTSEPFTTGQAWIDLIGMANYADTERIHKGRLQSIKRGEIYTSIRYLAERWHWSKEKTARTLKTFEKAKMLTINSNTNRTVLTLENYDKYQGGRDTKPTTNQDTTQDTTPTTTSPQKKKDKKNINKAKELHGAYGNVAISGGDFIELASEYGEERLRDLIEALSEYKEATGKTYQNDAAAIRTFARNRKPEREKSSFSKEY